MRFVVICNEPIWNVHNINQRNPMRTNIAPLNGISKFAQVLSAGKAQPTISNLLMIAVTGMVILLCGCSWLHLGGKGSLEIEQSNNPETWKEVYKMQATLWPLEMKTKEMEKKLLEIEKAANKIDKAVNDMRNELATTKLSSIQANKNTEFLHAEIVKLRSASIITEKTASGVIGTVEIKNVKKMHNIETIKEVEVSKKVDPETPSIRINDIKYFNVSQTKDKVLIYVNAINNPKIQTLIGERPRIVLDFFNTRTMDKEKYEMNVDGNFIKRIRISSYKEPIQKVRIVFDMMPNKKYSMDRTFSKKDYIYSFDLKPH